MLRNTLMALLPTVALLCGGSAFVVLYPPLPRDLGGVPDLDGEAERVRIPLEGGGHVDGWWLAGTRPSAVLLLHGYGRDHHRMWRYAHFLRREGHAVLAIDFRSARHGDRLPTTLGHHEQVDAQAALDWVRARMPAGGRIGVLGESLGASTAMLLAGRNPDVAAVVEDCGFATGQLAVEETCERWARLPRWPTAPVARWLGTRITGHDPYAIDVLTAMQAMSDRPVLFIQGLEDNRFSEDQVHDLWLAAGAKDPLWLIPGSGHNQGWVTHRDLYEQRVTSFFAHHLLGHGTGLPAGRLDPGSPSARGVATPARELVPAS